jgi:hypothetical protein
MRYRRAHWREAVVALMLAASSLSVWFFVVEKLR